MRLQYMESLPVDVPLTGWVGILDHFDKFLRRLPDGYTNCTTALTKLFHYLLRVVKTVAGTPNFQYNKVTLRHPHLWYSRVVKCCCVFIEYHGTHWSFIQTESEMQSNPVNDGHQRTLWTLLQSAQRGACFSALLSNLHDKWTAYYFRSATNYS